MTFVQRLTLSVRTNGFGATTAKFRSIIVDRWFDFRYGLNTCSCSDLNDLTIASGNRENGYLYKPVRILPLRKFFKKLHPMLPHDSVLVDFGSGKARVLMVGAEFGFRAARGVEFAHELCETSRKNCERYVARSRTSTELITIEADATKYEIQPDENVFILCNPFDDIIVKMVLDNIATSVREHPREVWIVYYNPRWGQVIERQENFPKTQEFNFWGHRFALYSNVKAAFVPVSLEKSTAVVKLMAGFYVVNECFTDMIDLIC
jgi:hypothetical protein